MLDAFHLPALPCPPTALQPFGSGSDAVELCVPQLTPDLLRRQIDALREAQLRHLADRPVGEIVRVVDAAASRLANPRDPLRQTAEDTLPALTGYSPPMVRSILDGMVVDWREDRLWALLRSEFGDPGVLDEFRPRPDAPGRTRAFGPSVTTHVFSGNVPGVAVTSLIRSLLVKSAALGKTASGEPLLPVLFARAVAEADAALGDCLAVTYWPGGTDELESIALSQADAVIVYGGSEVVSSICARTPPATRFLAYGHKLSFGVVGREALSPEQALAVAAAAALDATTFDQQGCVSPHLFYVEEGGEVTPREWAEMLAAEMDRLEVDLPRGSLTPGEASAIRQVRGEAEFAQLAGGGVELHQSRTGTTWTIIYDPDPAFTASCLNRVVRVKPVADFESVPTLVEAIGPLLQTVGIASDERRTLQLAAALGRLGASRIAPVGRMAWPPSTWHHDGHPPLGELVHWCDVE